MVDRTRSAASVPTPCCPLVSRRAPRGRHRFGCSELRRFVGSRPLEAPRHGVSPEFCTQGGTTERKAGDCGLGSAGGGGDGAGVERLGAAVQRAGELAERSEEHTSELQSLMRISYAVFCLKKKK